MVAYNFQRRFVDQIRAGLKRQTVRAAGKRQHAVPGDQLQLYCGMRSPDCFKIGEALCVETSPVVVWVDGKAIAIERSKVLMSRTQMEAFAREDGFASAAEMAEFWREHHPGIEKFEGTLIKWEPLDG